MMNVAKYLRLSYEDNYMQDESKSITNQRLIIDSFINETDEFIGARVVEFIDDGFSGTNMNRPAMQKLLSKLKDGEIDVIIVKDLSRFSRDYIELGKYLEKIFPYLGIRFIAINDNYDSKDTDGGIGSIDSNFKTLINDYYSKDTSEKIMSNYRVQTKKGKAILWAPSFGYMKDPKNKHQFLVDEVAAKTVKKIFELALKGWSIYKITRQLSQDGDITPAERKKMLTNMDYKHQQKTGEDDKYRWNVSTVSRITRNKEYTGCLIKGVRTRKEVGSKERVAVNPKDWIVVPNHHAPIISEEVFNEVQRLKAKNPKYFKKGQAIDSPIKSLVICKACGHKIQFIRRETYTYLSCRYGRLHKLECSNWSAEIRDVEKVVLETLQLHFNLLTDCTSVKKVMIESKDTEIKRYNKKITDLIKSKDEIAKLILNDYENYKSKNLTKDILMENKLKYNEKIEKIDEEILILKQQVKKAKDEKNSLLEKLEVQRKFYKITILTKDLVERTIDEILLGPDKEIIIKYKNFLSLNYN